MKLLHILYFWEFNHPLINHLYLLCKQPNSTCNNFSYLPGISGYNKYIEVPLKKKEGTSKYEMHAERFLFKHENDYIHFDRECTGKIMSTYIPSITLESYWMNAEMKRKLFGWLHESDFSTLSWLILVVLFARCRIITWASRRRDPKKLIRLKMRERDYVQLKTVYLHFILVYFIKN